MSKKVLTLIIYVILITLLIFNGIFFFKNKAQSSSTLYAFDTVMDITLNGKNSEAALHEINREISYLEALLSTENENSEIFSLNNNGKALASEDTATLLSLALSYKEKTNNAFNPFVYPMVMEWGFVTKDYNVPNTEKINELVKTVNSSALTLTDNKALLSNGASIDLGGIAKGYATQKLIDICKENNIKSALLNLGGNVYALGTKSNGTKWNIAIKSPIESLDYLGYISVKNKCVITSGGYERFFEENGKIYHHIIDPETGYPADSGLLSVTIVSKDPILADAYSTALYVMGTDEAVKFWRSNADAFDCILFTDKEELIITEGIKNDFSSDYHYTICKK